MAQPIEDGGL